MKMSINNDWRASRPTYLLRDIYEGTGRLGYIESRTNDRGEEFGRIFGYRMGLGAEANPNAIATWQVIEVEESELTTHSLGLMSAPRGVALFSGPLEGACAKLIALGADPSALPGMEVSKVGEFVMVATSGHGAVSRVSGESSLALANGREALAEAEGPSSQAIATGEAGQAVSSGCGSRAISTGEAGSATSEGKYVQSVTNGKCGVATNTGYCGQAVSTGASGQAVSSGTLSQAVATGYGGKAVAVGDRGLAISCDYGYASANGDGSVAVIVDDGMAGGTNGTLLVCIYRDQDGIPRVAQARVGENGIREYTWYWVTSDGRFMIDSPMNESERCRLTPGALERWPSQADEAGN
jgi:hypothetical protein